MENNVEITMSLEKMILMRRQLIGFLRELDKILNEKKQVNTQKT